MVEDVLADRGIVVTHKMVREWAGKLGREYASSIRRCTALTIRYPRLEASTHGKLPLLRLKRRNGSSFSE